MRPAFFNLFMTCTLLFSFIRCEQSGGVEHQTLHPVDSAHATRRQLAKAEPATEVSLYYAESSYKEGAHYAATVKWTLRYPALVAADQSGIHAVECGTGGIHIQFGSQSAKLNAESWPLPMVLITDGDSGNCAYDGEGRERYHPILLNSRIRLPTDAEKTSTFSGMRTKWRIVASEHEIKIGHVAAPHPPISIAQSAMVVRHRRSLPIPGLPTPSLPAPTTFSFAPSLNYNPQRNNATISEVPINLVTWAHGSLDLKCTNCYFNSNFRLTLETGSRILNFGISSIAKIVDKLHQAETTLKATVQSAAQSAQKAFLSRFTRLGEQLTDALSEFYSRVHDLATSTNVTEKAQLQAKITESATVVRQKSQQLLTFTVNQFQSSAASAPLPPAQKAQVIQQVRQVVSSTDAEVRTAIANGTKIAIDESQLAECTPSQEQNLQRRGLSCKPRNRRTKVGLTGRLKANIDIGLKLKGTGEIGSGDLTLFSASLVGIGIPGIVQVGPQARFISHTGLVFTSSATLSFGADFEWQNIDTVIDSKGDPKYTKLLNSKYVFNPHTPKFEISPQQLSLEQHFKPQLNFGIELLLGAQELLVGIGADVGFANTLQYATKISEPIPGCKGGIMYNFNVTAELDALVSVPTFAKFLLGRFMPSVQGGIIPLLKMTPYTILKHCFKLPSSCSSPAGWISKPNSLGSCFAKISSSDL